jgi:hypothetical protein
LFRIGAELVRLNAYAVATDRELWAFDRQTGQERLLRQTSLKTGV